MPSSPSKKMVTISCQERNQQGGMVSLDRAVQAAARGRRRARRWNPADGERALRAPILFFFFLMIRRPPISTLFPYTMLFRSLLASVELQCAAGPFAEYGSGSGLRDRKSTRLNASHLVISYAVFCLKKNNN